MIVIEKNIPLPSPRNLLSMGRPRIYPFNVMEVGDSFAIPLKKKNAVAATANRYGKNNNMKFATRLMDNGMVRVWRIA